MKAKTCEAGNQFGDYFNIIGKKLCDLNQGIQNNEVKNFQFWVFLDERIIRFASILFVGFKRNRRVNKNSKFTGLEEQKNSSYDGKKHFAVKVPTGLRVFHY